MYIVIFRARVKELDAEYSATAERMRELAMNEFGCIDFVSMAVNDDELTLSYWPDEDSIRRWRAHPEHRAAQQKGMEKWYSAYSVEVTEVKRAYKTLS